MVIDLSSIDDGPLPEPALPLILGDRVDDEWLEALFALKQVENADHRRVVPSMYAAIPKDEITVKVLDEDGNIAGTGLGILDRGYVGIYAIYIREDQRRKGLAEAVVRALLSEGAGRGAGKAYLQVVSENEPARRLYEKIGFRTEYECWFRVQTSS